MSPRRTPSVSLLGPDSSALSIAPTYVVESSSRTANPSSLTLVWVKMARKLCLTGLGDPRLILAVSPFGLAPNGGNTCPIDGDVELGNGRQERDYFPFHHLLTLLDRCDLNLPTNGLGSTLHLLDGDHHIGQFFQIRSSILKRLLGPHPGHHPSNAGRKRWVLKSQGLM